MQQVCNLRLIIVKYTANQGEEQVTVTWQKLKAGGIVLECEPQKIRDNFGFYFHFDNLMIEVETL